MSETLDTLEEIAEQMRYGENAPEPDDDLARARRRFPWPPPISCQVDTDLFTLLTTGRLDALDP